MSLHEQPKEIRSTFAVWQMFRQLGFSSDDLYVGMDPSGRILVSVVGTDQDCSIALGRSPMPKDEFERLWTTMAGQLSAVPEEQLKANYEEFITPERILMTLTAMDAYGISAPNDPRREPPN